ncbi:polyketide synthase [Colletotrichum tofieldiae]|nr:polyketide synthase [Colletotrichum tofieldiae]
MYQNCTDSFTRYRVNQGLKAASLDLALIAEAGWANDNYKLVASDLRTYGGVHSEQLMALLDVVCDPSYDCDGGYAQVGTIMDKPSRIYSLTREDRVF